MVFLEEDHLSPTECKEWRGGGELQKLTANSQRMRGVFVL